LSLLDQAAMLVAGGSEFSRLQSDQHEMVLTMPKNGNNIFVVRCKCMAEYRNVSSRYTNYDWIARVTSGDDAIKAYRIHRETGAKLVRL
jgi:hypothetical protein